MHCKLIVLGCLSVLVQAACGSSSSADAGSATSTGSVEGHTLAPRSAASATLSSNGNFLIVVVSSDSAYCEDVTAVQTRQNHIILDAALFTVSASMDSPVVAPGTFTILTSSTSSTAGNYANAQFHASDSSCNDQISSASADATSGTITIASVSNGVVSGSYNVLFGTDTVTGTFTAPSCAGLATQLSVGADETCVP